MPTISQEVFKNIRRIQIHTTHLVEDLFAGAYHSVFKGRGIESDALQAYVHFLLSAAYAKDEETRTAATKMRDQLAEKLTKQQIAQGQAMAEAAGREIQP